MFLKRLLNIPLIRISFPYYGISTEQQVKQPSTLFSSLAESATFILQSTLSNVFDKFGQASLEVCISTSLA